MRIAFISYEFPPDTGKGGIGTYVRQVAKALASVNWEVHIFAGSHVRTNSEFAEGYNVHRVKCENAHDFKYKVNGLFWIINASAAFDLIESPEINGNGWEIKKNASSSIPLVVRLHAPNYLVEYLKKKYLPFSAKLRFTLGALKRLKFDLGYWKPYNKKFDQDYKFTCLADFITAPSESMRTWVVRNWKIPLEKIIIIPNMFLPSQELLSLPVIEKAKYRRVLFFGRLNVLKGLVNATKAMSRILKQYPDWKFRVIGDDGPGPGFDKSMRNWMKAHLDQFGARVEFIDGVPYEDLPSLISETEIVLLPSLFESFSYTCAEAMAAGKAVIGSKNAGMADLVEDGKSGVLVDPYNNYEIYTSLKRLIDDDSYRQQLSVNARKRIVNDFDVNQLLKEFSDFYGKIVKKKNDKN